MFLRPGGDVASKLGKRRTGMPLSAAEAVEYDVASRAVARWLFPGDMARIQVAIEQGMHHPPDVQREVIAEYKRCAGRVAWSDPDRDTCDSPLRRSSAASRPQRRGLFTVLILVSCFISSILFNAVVRTPDFGVKLARMSMPMRFAGKSISTNILARGWSMLPTTTTTTTTRRMTAMISPLTASPDKETMAIDPATARKPSNVKVMYDEDTGIMDCQAAAANQNVSINRVVKMADKATSQLPPASDNFTRVRALFGRGTWNSDHERLKHHGVDAEIVNWNNIRQLNRVAALGIDIAIMHRADEWAFMDEVRKKGLFSVAVPPKTAFEVFDDKIKFSRWMLDSGFGGNLPTVHEDWADKMPDLPIVIKVASGSFGKGVHVVKTAEEWDKIISIVTRVGKDFLVQDAIQSKNEYTHNFAAIHGRLVSEQLCFHVSMKEDVYVKGKNARNMHNTSGFQSCEMQPHYKNVSDLLASIVNRSCFHGFGCMQYKLDPKDSAVKVIEINPRVCGSLNSNLRAFSRMIKAFVNKVLVGDPSRSYEQLALLKGNVTGINLDSGNVSSLY